MSRRSFSVIVNTVDRADSLSRTLEALEYLDHPNFEVVVVNGPSTDGTQQLLQRWAGRVKVANTRVRNLSESRNLGIALSSAEIVAFIDDDAYPDPAWLDRLEDAYDDPEVAAAGGPVYSRDGVDIQAWLTRQDRLGHPWTDRRPDPLYNPTWALAFPKSRQFVCTIGTNSSFRRSALCEIGGFDEEFGYYLDETDVCCRLVDHGYVVRALDDGFVYHKYLANDIREDDKVVRDFCQLLKSVFYLILEHGSETYSVLELSEALTGTASYWRTYVDQHVASGQLTAEHRRKFERDVVTAYEAALRAHESRTRRTRKREWFEVRTEPFLQFAARRRAEEKLHICFFTQEYPPAPVNGIGRVVHELATGLGRLGHLVRVLTRAHGTHTVDFEGGVWVHRIVPQHHAPPAFPPVPSHLWDYSASLLDELLRIQSHRPVDIVQVPNWDSEGVAVVLDGTFTHTLGLYTPLESVAATDTRLAEALASGDPVLKAMLETERFVYERSPDVLACGPGIVDEIEQRYEIALPRENLRHVPHGLSDISSAVSASPHPGTLVVLFAGRLEQRKGIDTLLASIPGVARDFPNVVFEIAGDDSFEGPSGKTFRAEFEGAHPELGDQVRFYGRVGDHELHQMYASCDVFVAPSRFESFGLVLVEAMMFSKPVVATNIGGLREVVEDGSNGYLVPADDSGSLAEAVARLLGSEELRARFGARSRQLFLERFTAETMVRGVERYYLQTTARCAKGTVGIHAHP
ncbi:MAG TPA: glycosyltransferase [Acidimicrobiales bacterium]|nr:glycosyltransferase [Acidimicrobiales bacterium]